MRLTHLRVVLDTNVLVSAMLHVDSPPGRILQSCERRELVPLLNRKVMLEYRLTLTHKDLRRRYPELSVDKVYLSLARLNYVGDTPARRARFRFPRDPFDAKFIELAIDGRANYLITRDPDLLSLSTGFDDASRRLRHLLPGLKIMTPEQFVGFQGL